MRFQTGILDRTISHQEDNQVSGHVGVAARDFLAVNSRREFAFKVRAGLAGSDKADIGDKMPAAKVFWNNFVEIRGDLRAGQQLPRSDAFREYAWAQAGHRRQNGLNWINSHLPS